MKSYIRLLLFALLLFFILPSSFAKDIYEDVFLYAQKLEEGGALEEAELEYKRYIFLQDYSAGDHQTQAFTKLAGLYEKKAEWELAEQTLKMAIQSSINDGQAEEERDQLRLKHIQYLSHLNDNLFLFSYIHFPDYSRQVRQAAFCADFEKTVNQGLWQNAQDKYNFAKSEFPDLFTQEESQIIEENLTAIFSYKPKKQMLAGYLSLMPGLGQLYAGDYLDSLNAFLLNGSLIAVSVWSLCSLDFWTFSLLEFNPLLHFMQGNMYNAQKDAYEYNQRKIKGFYSPIIDIIDLKIPKNAL
jgi:hypothetical protein